MHPGTLRNPKNLDRCCIYRVPSLIREENPKAYTPHLVLIGPLTLSLKFQALEALARKEDITNTKSMDYLDMEEQKKTYLAAFQERIHGEEIIPEFKRMIKEDIVNIRDSYSVSTDWIQTEDFVEMVLQDSVFIIDFMLRSEKIGRSKKTGDPLIDEPSFAATIVNDLILLENQLPYFIVEKLFVAVIPKIHPNKTIRDLIIQFFHLQGKIREDFKFGHFTDLHRGVLVETFPEYYVHNFNPIEHIRNAEKLASGGVKFEAVQEELSLNVRFENGCLKIPRLTVDDQLEKRLRNIMALEQRHYPFNSLVCSYISFLDDLIDSEKDVDLLAELGVIKNSTGEPAAVSRMVNKLGSGILQTGSYYSDMAVEVNKYSKNLVNRSIALLFSAYFGNPWAGIATIAAVSLLVMAIIQSWASVTQVKQNKS